MHSDTFIITAFGSIVIMSAAAVCLWLVIFFLKPFTRKYFGAAWQYYALLSILVILFIPFSFKLPETVNPKGAEYTKQYFTAYESTNLAENISEIEAFEKEYALITDIVIDYMAFIWIIGVAIAFSAKVCGYILLIGKLRKTSVPYGDICGIPKGLTVRKTELSLAPLLVGVIKPTLYLPAQLSDAKLSHVLSHELVHYYRHDLFFKWLTAIAVSVHWFNPMIYIYRKQLDEECEISCDALATCHFSESEKTSYMQTILSLASESFTPRPLTSQIVSGKKILIRRFTQLKSNRIISKNQRIISVLTAALLALSAIFASGVLAGNYRRAQSIEESASDGNAVSKAESTVVLSNEAVQDASNNGQIEFLLSFPVPSYSGISQGFNPEREHYAVDIIAENGDDVISATDGTVTEADYSTKLGNYIMIVNENGMSFLYTHLSHVSVKDGDAVVNGQPIGKVGSTGMATGPHLHFEVTSPSGPLNPMEMFE